MLSLFRQPFPPHTLAGSIRMAAVIGLFISAILLVFQPFGLRDMADGTAKILFLIGYGALTFACISLSSIILSGLFPGWFKAATWTIGREILISLFNFLLIGFCNTLYTFVLFNQPISLPYLLWFEGITVAVGILPVSLIVLFRYARLLSRNLKLAQEMNSELKTVPSQPISAAIPVSDFQITADLPKSVLPQQTQSFTFSSETGTEQITLNPQNFLFATAADNYAELHFLENGLAKKSLIRSSLTRLEELVKPDPKIVRCHRAYLVNLEQVLNFSGNAQGLKLELKGTNELIPVSRKMVPEIKSLLHG